MQHRLIIIGILLIPVLLLIGFGGTDIHFHRKKREDRVRVACIGDSITNGALIPGCFFRAYPARLSRLLGESYQVENFGLNDRTLQRQGDKPYSKEKEYRRSLKFEPDIAVLLLGTNDTKAKNWTSGEAFLKEYLAFVEQFRREARPSKIILCIPPWAKNAENRLQWITNDTAAERLPQVAGCIRRAGAVCGLPVADLYEETEDRPELYSFDALHPNAKGAWVIAERILREIEKS